jgi:hypothetical protein
MKIPASLSAGRDSSILSIFLTFKNRLAAYFLIIEIALEASETTT